MRQVRIVRNGAQSRQMDRLSTGHSLETSKPVTLAIEKRNRLEKRSLELVKAVKALDTATDSVYRRELIEWIRQEYAQRMGGSLFALFSRCYLGEPFIDHHINISGEIVEHYQRGDSVPSIFTQARALAASPAYAYIEIYTDGQIVAVAEDGSSR